MRERPQPREAVAPGEIVAAPPGWHARQVEPPNAVKVYRCPGCNQEIRSGVRHVVAWQEGADAYRRHWHTPCWQRRNR